MYLYVYFSLICENCSHRDGLVFVFVFVFVSGTFSHRDGFSFHEENSSPADHLLHLLEKSGKGRNRGKTVSSQPMLEGSESVLQHIMCLNFTPVAISLPGVSPSADATLELMEALCACGANHRGELRTPEGYSRLLHWNERG